MAIMFRFVESLRSGSSSPPSRTRSRAPSSGSHVGARMGRRSTRYVRGAPASAPSSGRYPAPSNTPTTWAMAASKPEFPGSRKVPSMEATVSNAFWPESSPRTASKYPVIVGSAGRWCWSSPSEQLTVASSKHSETLTRRGWQRRMASARNRGTTKNEAVKRFIGGIPFSGGIGGVGRHPTPPRDPGLSIDIRIVEVFYLGQGKADLIAVDSAVIEGSPRSRNEG
jgi:hypothetical protein